MLARRDDPDTLVGLGESGFEEPPCDDEPDDPSPDSDVLLAFAHVVDSSSDVLPDAEKTEPGGGATSAPEEGSGVCPPPPVPSHPRHSAAASSSSMIAPPSPASSVRSTGSRLPPTVELKLPSGVLSYYDADKRFQATCCNETHRGSSNGCVLTRYAKKNSHLKGKPVSFLVEWLTMGSVLDGKPEHWDKAMLTEIEADKARLAEIKADLLTTPVGRQLYSFEL